MQKLSCIPIKTGDISPGTESSAITGQQTKMLRYGRDTTILVCQIKKDTSYLSEYNVNVIFIWSPKYWVRSILGCIQKFPDWVDKEI
jgi:hypothetical protein